MGNCHRRGAGGTAQDVQVGAAPQPRPASPPASPAGVVWSCQADGSGRFTDYAAADSAAVERLYQRHRAGGQTPPVRLSFGTFDYAFDFAAMQQRNTRTGMCRTISRRPPAEGLSPPPAPAEAPGEDPLKGIDEGRLQEVLRVVAAIDERVARMEELEGQPGYTAAGLVRAEEAGLIDAVFASIAAQFRRPQYQQKYHYNWSADAHCLNLGLHTPVPQYYANVKGQSIWQRKMLSIAGLRNLVQYGPAVFEDLRASHFSGCYADYAGPAGPAATGVHKMKYYTGNMVDLDTTVLRCSDNTVRHAINMANCHEGSSSGYRDQYSDGSQFGDSAQAREIAAVAASDLINQFVTRFRLTPEQVRRRHLDFDVPRARRGVHRATDSSDRGKHPLWQYVNAGQNSFHANVPNMPGTYGALLRAPYHAARAMCIVLCRFDGDERQRWVDAFFEDCIADSCFNAKWKAIEEFNEKLAHLGTIEWFLQRIEREQQAEFGAIYDEGLDDAEEEPKVVAAYARHTRCGEADALVARAPCGVLRAVTRADVEAHVARIYAASRGL